MPPHITTQPVLRALRRSLVWKRHRSVSPADVILGSYPRSGGTWLAIMLAEYLTDSTFDLRSGDDAVPMVGYGAPVVMLPNGGGLLRSHELYRPEYRSNILLIRDPRNVAVSYYHFQHDRLKRFDGSVSEFVRRFTAGTVDHYGAWHDHVKSWLDSGGSQVVVRYEDLRHEPVVQLRRLIQFLGANVDPVAVEAIVESNSMTRMREKEDRSTEAPAPLSSSSERFVRSGAVDGWHESLDPASIALIESVMGEAMTRVGYFPAAA